MVATSVGKQLDVGKKAHRERRRELQYGTATGNKERAMGTVDIAIRAAKNHA